MPSGSAEAITRVVLFDDEKLQPCLKHTFDTTDSFKPVKIEINGRKKRRVCAVLAEGGRLMRIYDLDFKDESADSWDMSRLEGFDAEHLGQ